MAADEADLVADLQPVAIESFTDFGQHPVW
jgi:hypothetical protein